MRVKLLFALMFCLLSLAQAYTISGNCISYENSYGKITQCPHTLTDFTNDVYLNVTSYIAGTINLDSAFGFDTSVIVPSKASYFAPNVAHVVPTVGPVLQTVSCVGSSSGIINETNVWCMNTTGQNQTLYCPSPRVFPDQKTCRYNKTMYNGTGISYYDDWSDISHLFSTKTYAGKVYYIIENVSFSKDQTRQLKIQVKVQPNKKGKYDLLMKRSLDSWADVLSDLVPGVILDPWFDTSYTYRLELNLSCPDGGICDDNIATPILITNATILSHMNYTTGNDLRYVVECSGVNTQRGIFVQNISASNASIWINYTNQSGCLHNLYYGKVGATSVSSPYGVFMTYDNFDTNVFNATMWTGSAVNPNQLGNGWIELDWPSNKFYVYSTSSQTNNITVYIEQMQRTTVGIEDNMYTEWAGGGAKNGYFIDAIGIFVPPRLANTLSVWTTLIDSTSPLTTTLDQKYLYSVTKVLGASGKFNMSRQSTDGDQLAYINWSAINEKSGILVSSDQFVIGGVGGGGGNLSIFWAGITVGTKTPFQSSSYFPEYYVNGSPANSTVNQLTVQAYDEISTNRIYFGINLANSSMSTSNGYQFQFNDTYTAFPSGALTLTITNTTEYYQRTYYHTTNPNINETISTYLLPINATTKSVTFYVQTSTSQPIAGATVTIQRTINGSFITMGSMITDNVGTAHFWMDSLTNYRIIVTDPLYTTLTTAITPTETSYIIYLTQSITTGFFESSFHDVQWTFTPTGNLNGNTTYIFNYTTHSNNKSLVWTAWRIYNYTTLLHQNNVTGENGSSLTYSLKPGHNASIIVVFYFLHTNQSSNSIASWYINLWSYWMNNTYTNNNLQQALPAIGTTFSPITVAILTIIIGVMVAGWVGQFSPTGGVMAFIAVLGLGIFIGGNLIISASLVLLAIITIVAYYLWRSGG